MKHIYNFQFQIYNYECVTEDIDRIALHLHDTSDILDVHLWKHRVQISHKVGISISLAWRARLHM